MMNELKNVTAPMPNYAHQLCTSNVNSIAFYIMCWPGSSVGIATELRAGRSGLESQWGRDFFICPDRPWVSASLLYFGYRVFPGGKVRPRCAADHSPPFSAAVMEE